MNYIRTAFFILVFAILICVSIFVAAPAIQSQSTSNIVLNHKDFIDYDIIPVEIYNY